AGELPRGLAPGHARPGHGRGPVRAALGYRLLRYRCAGAPVDRHGRHSGAAPIVPHAGTAHRRLLMRRVDGRGTFLGCRQPSARARLDRHDDARGCLNGSVNEASAAPGGRGESGRSRGNQAGARRPDRPKRLLNQSAAEALRATTWGSRETRMASLERQASVSGFASTLLSGATSSDVAIAKPAARAAVFSVSILMAPKL